VALSACGSLCKQWKQAKSSLRMTVRQKARNMWETAGCWQAETAGELAASTFNTEIDIKLLVT